MFHKFSDVPSWLRNRRRRNKAEDRRRSSRSFKLHYQKVNQNQRTGIGIVIENIKYLFPFIKFKKCFVLQDLRKFK